MSNFQLATKSISLGEKKTNKRYASCITKLNKDATEGFNIWKHINTTFSWIRTQYPNIKM